MWEPRIGESGTTVAEATELESTGVVVGCIWVSMCCCMKLGDESKNVYEGEVLGVIDPYGKTVSSNVT